MKKFDFSPTNHVAEFFVRANKFASWKTGLIDSGEVFSYSIHTSKQTQLIIQFFLYINISTYIKRIFSSFFFYTALNNCKDILSQNIPNYIPVKLASTTLAFSIPRNQLLLFFICLRQTLQHLRMLLHS